MSLQKILRKDATAFIGWLSLCFFVFYFTPNIVKIMLVFAMLFLYLKRNNNVFWFVLFFTLILDIGGFFSGQTSNLFAIGPIPISLTLLFVWVSMLKVLVSTGQRHINIFSKPLTVWLAYLLLLIFIGFAKGLSGGGSTGFRFYFQIIYTLLLLPMFFVLPKVLHSKHVVERLASLMFISLFINIMGQIATLSYGEPVYLLLGPQNSSDNLLTDNMPADLLIRPIHGPWTVILAFLFSFFFMLQNRGVFRVNYLRLVAFASFMSIFITATRGWIVAFTFFFGLIIVFFAKNNFKKTAVSVLSIILVFLLLYYLWLPFGKQIDKSYERLTTLESLIEGDLTADGTLIRLTDRRKPVMDMFYKRPFFGHGFTSDVMDKRDEHVGNQTILMSGGILGYLIIVYLIGSIIAKSVIIHMRAKLDPGYHNEILMIPFFITSLFIIHSSSTSLFGYDIYTFAWNNMFFVAAALSVINVVLVKYDIKTTRTHGSSSHN